MSATAKEFANDPCSSVKRGEMIPNVVGKHLI